jgi:hypothetical protein
MCVHACVHGAERGGMACNCEIERGARCSKIKKFIFCHGHEGKSTREPSTWLFVYEYVDV